MVWQGGLVAPTYGLYTFALPGGGKLEVDGATALDTQAAGGARQTTLALARGMHDVRLSATLANAQARVELQWGGFNTALGPTPPQYLFNGPTGGLSGELAPGAPSLDAPDPFAGVTPRQRRSDPAIGFQEGSVDFGAAPLVARWQGQIQINVAGAYHFETRQNGMTRLFIDGRPVGPPGGPAVGDVTLTAGAHEVDLRYAWQGGPARLLWLWAPAGGAPQNRAAHRAAPAGP